MSRHIVRKDDDGFGYRIYRNDHGVLHDVSWQVSKRWADTIARELDSGTASVLASGWIVRRDTGGGA